MKVLHVIETLARGGAERYLVTLLPELRRQGVSPAVGVLRPPIKLQAELEEAGIPVTVFPQRHKWSLLQNAQDIADEAQKLGADVIHAHLYFPMVTTSLARITGKTDAKTCVTFHNLAYSGANRSTLRLVAKRNLARAVLPRGISSYFAVSAAVARHYEDALGIKDVSVQYNPIDLSFVASFEAKKKPSDGIFRIVLPGRLVHEKGHLDLIAAAKKLPQSDRAKFSILFAGEGPMRETLEAEIRANELGDLIKILGELKHPEFLSTMANADIVAVPSRFEGFGLVALEAMALGKPIIASDAGGLPEVLGDVGLLVPSANPTALAEALQKMVEDPNLREELGEKAKKRAFQGFDVQSAAGALISSYKDMLDPSVP